MPVTGAVNSNFAANAYANSQKIMGAAQTTEETGDTDKSGSGGGAGGVSFADILKNNIEDSVKTLKTGEDLSAQAVTGKADLTDVVQAVNSAEITLQTVVAVRDRMISAYQEIMRMPI